jgi:hypothetical protein
MRARQALRRVVARGDNPLHATSPIPIEVRRYLEEILDWAGLGLQLIRSDDPAIKLLKPLLQGGSGDREIAYGEEITYGRAAMFAEHVLDAIEDYCVRRKWYLGESPARRYRPQRSVTLRIDDVAVREQPLRPATPPSHE